MNRTWHRNIDGALVAADSIQICNSNNLNVDCSNYSKESSKEKKPYTFFQKMFFFGFCIFLGQCLACTVVPFCCYLTKILKDKYNSRSRGRERTRVRTTGDNNSTILYETAYNNINNNNDNNENENDIEERLTESKESDVSSDDDCSLHPSNDLSIHNSTSTTSLLLPPLSASI